MKSYSGINSQKRVTHSTIKVLHQPTSSECVTTFPCSLPRACPNDNEGKLQKFAMLPIKQFNRKSPVVKLMPSPAQLAFNLNPIPTDQTSSERASSPSQFRSERGEGLQISVKKNPLYPGGRGSRKSWIFGTFISLLPEEWGRAELGKNMLI